MELVEYSYWMETHTTVYWAQAFLVMPLYPNMQRDNLKFPGPNEKSVTVPLTYRAQEPLLSLHCYICAIMRMAVWAFSDINSICL